MKRLLLLSYLLLSASLFFAQTNKKKFSGWKKADTKHFTFIYEDAQKEFLEGYVKYADEAWNKIAKIYSIPQDKTRVYITGRLNIANAFTYESPQEMVMLTTPFTDPTFTFRDNWQKTLFTHELVHLANFTFEDKSPIYNKLYGPFSTSIDFLGVDGWALEGLTTVLETELTAGGRGRSPFFELEYKAVTLDNGFMPYENVGFEKEPPHSQAYVIGYLLARTIADRYGISALADIERNRSWGTPWAEAVKLVTNETPQNMYRDLRISLAKKYADERKIPEGRIISTRALNTNTYKPAIVFDDGSFIALRTAPGIENAVVKVDPNARKGINYIENVKTAKDMNTLFSETILFTADFPDSDCVTADKNQTVYTISSVRSYDKAPGMEFEQALFKWNRTSGLKQLTEGVSLYSPSVSRDGKLLVAIEQNGLHTRLVKVNTNNGEISVLLEKADKSFMLPSVNEDGTKIAFLEIDDTRARIALMDAENPENYEIIGNNGEQIYDPGYISWNADGSLSYTCNYRGRLEAFEAIETNSGWNYKPVVADPIGVTWSYKNNFGIFYATKSSSGNVIKLKPASEWGVVPDFDGPSPAGQIITFGSLQNDYPDFKPYNVLAEVEMPEMTKEEQQKKQEELLLLKKQGKPIPIQGKYVKHRSEEKIKQAEESNETITEISEEKKFISLPQPLFYMPFIELVENKDTDKVNFGIGGFMVGITPRLQMSNGIFLLDCFYYPKLENFSGSADFFLPIYNNELDIIITRNLSYNSKEFNENNFFAIGAISPLLHKISNRNEINLSLITSLSYILTRTSSENTNINGNFEKKQGNFAQLGFEYFMNIEQPARSDVSFDLVGLLVGYYDYNTNKVYAGIEGESSMKVNLNSVGYGLSASGRFTPFPKDTTPEFSHVKYAGKKIDCTYPLSIIPRAHLQLNNFLFGLFDLVTYTETFLGISDLKTISLLQSAAFGAELSISQGLLNLALGTSYKYNFKEKNDYNFYISLKYGWLRL